MTKETAEFIKTLYREYRDKRNQNIKDDIHLQIMAFIEGYASAVSDLK